MARRTLKGEKNTNMLAPKDFNNKRLWNGNIREYLKKKYKGTKVIKCTSSKLLNFKPLLQDDYGEAGDCTLTSLTACVNYYLANSKPIEEIYNYVEKIAKKWGYKGNIGTFPLFIQRIYNQTLKHFPCAKKRTAQGYIKGVGFNFNTIKNILNKNTPIVLSIKNDGRNYYTNHTITIVGYMIYSINNKHTANILVVYDNWTKSESFIDFDVLPIMASINY